MKSWFDNLNARERWIFGLGAGLVMVLILYGVAWQPFQTELRNLRHSVVEQRQALTWMQQAAQEVKRLKGSAGSVSQTPQHKSGQSLLTLVDGMARSAGLDKALKRVEPEGDNKLQVRLEQVSFDQMILWLATLEQQYGVEIVNAVVDRQDESGRVNARLILQESKS